MNWFYYIFYQPVLNVLIFIYNIVGNIGVSIILVTLIIRLILYPLSKSAIVAQKKMSVIQPKIKEVQEKYKDNKEEQSKRLMELYKEGNVNPFSGCLPLLIQLPILFALYRVFWYGFTKLPIQGLYSFIASPAHINNIFLGFNLAAPNIILAVIAAISQFFQAKMIMPKDTFKKTERAAANDFSKIMNQEMIFLMPLFTLIILFRLPSNLALYWTFSSLFTILQQWYILKSNKD